MSSGTVERLSRTERVDGDAAPRSVLLLAKKRAESSKQNRREWRVGCAADPTWVAGGVCGRTE